MARVVLAGVSSRSMRLLFLLLLVLPTMATAGQMLGTTSVQDAVNASKAAAATHSKIAGQQADAERAAEKERRRVRDAAVRDRLLEKMENARSGPLYGK